MWLFVFAWICCDPLKYVLCSKTKPNHIHRHGCSLLRVPDSTHGPADAQLHLLSVSSLCFSIAILLHRFLAC